jgi:hypothetical protein
MLLRDDFSRGVAAHWRTVAVGGGRLEPGAQGLRLLNPGTTAERYTNAQIDDYQGRPRREFLWSPPLALTVRARFSHPAAPLHDDGDCDYVYASSQGAAPTLMGTAGFGFWNDPFLMTGKRRPALPRAIWFFYASPPSNMKLDLHTPGCGWKAATIDAATWPFLLLAPTIPLAVPLMHLPAAYRRLWPVGQRAIRVSEASVAADMTAWHTYVIEWGQKRARFAVDGTTVLDCSTPPQGPLGLVIWLDNQYLAINPQGRLRYGLLANPGEQWMELSEVGVTAPGTGS